MLQDCTYNIPLGNEARSYFENEFHYSRDLDGNIIVPDILKEKKSGLKETLKKLKKQLMEEQAIVAIHPGTDLHTFFISEGYHTESASDNIYVPIEEYTSRSR